MNNTVMFYNTSVSILPSSYSFYVEIVKNNTRFIARTPIVIATNYTISLSSTILSIAGMGIKYDLLMNGPKIMFQVIYTIDSCKKQGIVLTFKNIIANTVLDSLKLMYLKYYWLSLKELIFISIMTEIILSIILASLIYKKERNIGA